jgi:hypothetical protein
MNTAKHKVAPVARTQVSGTPTGESGYETTFERDQSSDNLIKGERIKFSGSNIWTDANGKPLDLSIKYLVTGARIGLQRWAKKDDKRVPEVILEKPLPDVDELNAAIPIAQWEKGLDNKPKAPWALVYVLYLVNPITGQMFTYVNSTVGTRIAYSKLLDQVCTAQSLRGEDVVPIIRLSTKPMKTEFGERPRPHYEVLELRSAGTALANKQAPQIEYKPVEDEFDDELSL